MGFPARGKVTGSPKGKNGQSTLSPWGAKSPNARTASSRLHSGLLQTCLWHRRKLDKRRSGSVRLFVTTGPGKEFPGARDLMLRVLDALLKLCQATPRPF